MTDYGNNNIGKKSKEMHYNDISGWLEMMEMWVFYYLLYTFSVYFLSFYSEPYDF